MNVVDLIEDARPEVAPMPLADRRMVRERLFGTADDVARTTIRERSNSGAVTATAPAGYRARKVSSRPKRPRSSGSWAKIAAGLLVLVVAVAAGWSWYADSGDDTPELAAETTTTTSSTTTTVAPTTTVEPTRTGVSPTAPVVFPLGLVPIEEAVVDVAATDDEFALLRAGDGTWLRLELVDGGVPDTGGLDFVSVGAVNVAPFAFGPGAPWIYVFQAPCGAARLIDAAEQERLRPVIADVLEGFSIDAGGTVDALLPASVRVIEAGSGREEYRTVFLLEASPDGEGGDGDRVTLRQIPGGSLAQLVPAGAQPSEMIWLGEPAVGTGDLDPADDETGPVTVFWRDGDTVFAVSSETVPLDRLETFVSGLRAATTDDWVERFSASRVDSTVTIGTPNDGGEATAGDGEAADPEPACSPQPSLGPTFLP